MGEKEIFLEEFHSSNHQELWDSIVDDRKNPGREQSWSNFDDFSKFKLHLDDCNHDGADEFGFVLRNRRDGPIIGTIHLFQVNDDKKEAELGYALHQEYVGNGYATAGIKVLLRILEKMGLHRILIKCDEANKRAWQVAERCGFRLTDSDGERRNYELELLTVVGQPSVSPK